MNNHRGGVILLGCKLEEEEKGKLHPRIKEANTKYNSEENRLKFQAEIERIRSNLNPNEPGEQGLIKYDFVTFKMNPFQDRHQSSLCLIPRVVVQPSASANPHYLKVTKTLAKSEYYIYRHEPVNYNLCEAKEVEEQEIYRLFHEKHKHKGKNVQAHWGSECLEPERNYFEADSDEESESEEETFS